MRAVLVAQTGSSRTAHQTHSTRLLRSTAARPDRRSFETVWGEGTTRTPMSRITSLFCSAVWIASCKRDRANVFGCGFAKRERGRRVLANRRRLLDARVGIINLQGKRLKIRAPLKRHFALGVAAADRTATASHRSNRRETPCRRVLRFFPLISTASTMLSVARDNMMPIVMVHRTRPSVRTNTMESIRIRGTTRRVLLIAQGLPTSPRRGDRIARAREHGQEPAAPEARARASVGTRLQAEPDCGVSP